MNEVEVRAVSSSVSNWNSAIEIVINELQKPNFQYARVDCVKFIDLERINREKYRLVALL